MREMLEQLFGGWDFNLVAMAVCLVLLVIIIAFGQYVMDRRELEEDYDEYDDEDWPATGVDIMPEPERVMIGEPVGRNLGNAALYDAVTSTSSWYKKAKNLNALYRFHEIQAGWSFFIRFEKRRQFNKYDLSGLLDAHLKKDGLLLAAVQDVLENRESHRAYLAERQAMASAMTEEGCREMGIDYEKYLAFERKLVDSLELFPPVDIRVECCKLYVSRDCHHVKEASCTYPTETVLSRYEAIHGKHEKAGKRRPYEYDKRAD